MALPPIGPGPTHPRQGTHGLSPSDERAATAEKEANQRVARANRFVEDAQREADYKLEKMQDQYERREAEQALEIEGRLEKEKLKGYERIRDVQRAQQRELARLRQQGEKDLAALRGYYKTTVEKTEHEGSAKLREMELRQARQVEFEKSRQEGEMSLLLESQKHRHEEFKATTEAKTRAHEEQERARYEQLKERSMEANLRAEESFNRKHSAQVAAHDESIAGIQSRANRAIRDIRRDTSVKLAAYAERQRDPFYRMLDLDASLDELDDEFVLTATIPEHEQKHVSVSVKGGQLVLSGQRRSEEKLELSRGRTQATSAFQTYRESFPLNWPVEAKLMTRSFDGDQLVVRIPKKQRDLEYHSPAKKPAPERARVERPKFPDNLPLAKAQAEMPAEPQDPHPAGASKGSGTLT